MSQNNQQYNIPADFVNVKRTKEGVDEKGRRIAKFTIGLGNDKQGNEVNALDRLIEVLEQYRGKQVNLDFRTEDKEDGTGRSFPSTFLRVTEMIPKNAGTKTVYTPKVSKTEATKARAEQIRGSFNSKG